MDKIGEFVKALRETNELLTGTEWLSDLEIFNVQTYQEKG